MSRRLLQQARKPALTVCLGTVFYLIASNVGAGWLYVISAAIPGGLSNVLLLITHTCFLERCHLAQDTRRGFDQMKRQRRARSFAKPHVHIEQWIQAQPFEHQFVSAFL